MNENQDSYDERWRESYYGKIIMPKLIWHMINHKKMDVQLFLLQSFSEAYGIMCFLCAYVVISTDLYAELIQNIFLTGWLFYSHEWYIS